MSATIFYYSGTGNSLWVAKTIAAEIDGTIQSIATLSETDQFEGDIAGIVFPVYMWGVPTPVLKVIQHLKKMKPNYLFAVATNAGQVANTLLQLKKVLKKSNLNLNSGFDLKMPSNYIPWGGPGSEEKLKMLFKDATKKIDSIIDIINAKKSTPPEHGPLYQKILFSGAAYNITKGLIPKMDKSFYVDDRCNGCGICVQVCPAQNITLTEQKPIWNHSCEQCFACLQWCPQESIQFGKKTPNYDRYHHPEIKLKEMIIQK